jgi:hypothetical protein
VTSRIGHHFVAGGTPISSELRGERYTVASRVDYGSAVYIN